MRGGARLALGLSLVGVGCSARACEASAPGSAAASGSAAPAPPSEPPAADGGGAAPKRRIHVDRWGYVDVRGAWVVEPRFASAGAFERGRAVVAEPGWQDEVATLDREGRFVGERRPAPRGLEPATPEEERRSAVYGPHREEFPEFFDFEFSERGAVARGPRGSRVLDQKGRLLFASPLSIEAFHGELAAYEDPRDESCPRRQGIVDIRGKIVRSAEFTFVGRASEGLVPVCLPGPGDERACAACECPLLHNDCGFVDVRGRVVIPIDRPTRFYESARPALLVRSFHDGLVATLDDERGWGFRGKDGRWVIPPRFSQALDFTEGLAAVALVVEELVEEPARESAP